jgi:PKD domain/Secretion system C-terminal sorting domain
MKRKLLPYLFLLVCFVSLNGQSNLTIDQSYTVEEMVMDFFNHPDITISNVNFTGGGEAYGFFDSGDPSETALGIGAGILITSGNANNAVGPNVNEGVSGFLNLPGDPDLELLGSYVTYDASVISFDLVASDELLLDFTYVFGSDEYCEFVNSAFNDVFGFFVSGPGLSGPFSNNAINIATLPGAADYVSINNINHLMNSNFFIPNSILCGDALDPDNLEYDGITTPLQATFIAMEGETYHIRLAVADRADGIFDSGVFLGFNSLSTDSLLVPPAQFSANNTFSNGAEFVNESKYATSFYWDFGNGITSTEKNPASVTYAAPGDYMVTLTTQNYCCTDVFTQTVTVSYFVNAVKDNNDFTFELFPNPVNKVFRIRLTESTAISTVKVLDLLGKVMDVNYNLTGSDLDCTLEQNIVPGIYYVQVLLEDGRQGVQRFVKR